ncbi:radical SAM family heme chaperone HemW [Bacteroidota bacterium]
MAGIYIHVPFCKQACYYCDFHFSTNLSLTSDYCECLLNEISLETGYLNGESIETIYFGGGTPSILDSKELAKMLTSVQKQYNVTDDPEVTIEANPDDLDPVKTADLFEMGFNRLSIGIQSFHEKTLQYLHRVHNSRMAIEAYDTARNVGFNNINIDLIFAVHPDSSNILNDDLTQAINLNPEHISIYNLTIETSTVFGNWLKKGKIHKTGEEESAKQYEILINRLEADNYIHYEISNFSRQGWESKHNINYWTGKSYLGIGPGAHSFNQQSRQFNIKNNARYIQSLREDTIPFEMIDLSKEELTNEYILTNLRTKWGINLALFEKKFSFSLLELKRSKVEFLKENGWISNDPSILRLTNKGKLLADSIASDLFID